MSDSKRILAAIYCTGLRGIRPTPEALARLVCTEGQNLESSLRRLTKAGYVKDEAGRMSLTSKGRRKIVVVFIGGGFEVIHRGHLYTIETAKSLGDVLVVSVARDSTIRRRKHRAPLANEKERVKLLSSLRQVDAAILGAQGDIYKTLVKVRPDVVALGYDQYHSESEIAREARRRGLRIRVVRLDSPYPKTKTSSLLRET
ncbi:MAG TPA: adenylyltransferase/cytidyltransferase family protein [Nitrososphaerales archaeon]|nr:adenylyltransferase/cytidyltransferase family protein [Nitrososphaerales archaeon]